LIVIGKESKDEQITFHSLDHILHSSMGSEYPAEVKKQKKDKERRGVARKHEGSGRQFWF
jgi:hypothetical protein